MNKKITPHTAIIGAILLTCSTVFIPTVEVVGQEFFEVGAVPGEGRFDLNGDAAGAAKNDQAQAKEDDAAKLDKEMTRSGKRTHMYKQEDKKEEEKKDDSKEENQEGQNGDSANGGGGGGASSSGSVCSGGSCSAGGGGGGAASSGGGGGGGGGGAGGGALGQVGQSILGGLAGGGGNQGQNPPSQPGQGSPANKKPAPGTDKGDGDQLPNTNGGTSAGSPSASGARPAVPELRPVR